MAMQGQAAIIATAAGLLLLASAANTDTPAPNIEAGDGAASLGLGLAGDWVAGQFYQLTEAPANVDHETAQRNIGAFLRMLQQAEGTATAADPYRVCFGYAHTIQDLREHPAITGEWRGERLSDTMCINAGHAPGCISSAAGAYQIIKGTWQGLRDRLSLQDFSPASQDAAACDLLRQRGALQDVMAGRVGLAIVKAKPVWASLPGNYARQGQRSVAQLAQWFDNAGGTQA